LAANGRTGLGDSAQNYYTPGDTIGALQASAGGAATTQFASNLKLANTYQASVYVEQQIGEFTLRTGFVYNNLIDIAGTVNAGRPLSAYTTPVTFYVPNSANVATASSPNITLWNLTPSLTGPSVQVYENLPKIAITITGK
jgi:hypothetical protein